MPPRTKQAKSAIPTIQPLESSEPKPTAPAAPDAELVPDTNAPMNPTDETTSVLKKKAAPRKKKVVVADAEKETEPATEDGTTVGAVAPAQKKSRSRKAAPASSNPVSLPESEQPSSQTHPLFPPQTKEHEQEHESVLVATSSSDKDGGAAKKEPEPELEPVAKKRGRKPKGSKVVSADLASASAVELCPNVVLHLQCTIQDMLERNRELSDPTYTSNGGGTNGSVSMNGFGGPVAFLGQTHYWVSELPPSDASSSHVNPLQNAPVEKRVYSPSIHDVDVLRSNQVHDFASEQGGVDAVHVVGTVGVGDSVGAAGGNGGGGNAFVDRNEIGSGEVSAKVQLKLKQLEAKLKITSASNKKSACFWDTCHFTNSPVYLPLHIINGVYHVYGNFCSPECAAAHLMNNDKLDTSTKFERYAMLNHMYSSVYEYKRPIKLALNPHYSLDKFMGTLTIQEYRALNQCDRNYLLVDKPLSRTLPELIANGDNHILNNKFIPTTNATKMTPSERTKDARAKFGIEGDEKTLGTKTGTGKKEKAASAKSAKTVGTGGAPAHEMLAIE